jgi:hypothetical protein
MASEREDSEILNAYMGLGSEEIVRLVLWLLVEESLRNRLADFRQKLPSQPVEREEELVV